ncbi:MAG: 3-deoxy-8-phosphooctulonate synthase [Candidatus Omnitrophica bacterium]|nr:3-deoxy-8-phosphooctulonate synthase [Candidatus Omnitrophota bacterium]MBU1853809.1 3-deoxy-8-phosphooctulonate synthase [Candidatus Omnitrophota bacterium]
MAKEIKIKNIKIGESNPIVLIAGPCVIESARGALDHAKAIKKICEKEKIPFIFKSSYDKANRSSLKSYRGPGIDEGLKILAEIKKELDIPILSDVHCRVELDKAVKVLDIIQVPAFLCRQTDFIIEIAKTNKIVNIKKAQFLAPWDIGNVIEKIENAGNENIIITERGTMFGYNNLVSDLRSLQIMRKFNYPLIYDATHSVQLPGGKGIESGGERQFVTGLSRAAVAMGCEGLFLEVHKEPDKALCDGANMITLETLEGLLKDVKEIDNIVKMKKQHVKKTS